MVQDRTVRNRAGWFQVQLTTKRNRHREPNGFSLKHHGSFPIWAASRGSEQAYRRMLDLRMTTRCGMDPSDFELRRTRPSPSSAKEDQAPCPDSSGFNPFSLCCLLSKAYECGDRTRTLLPATLPHGPVGPAGGVYRVLDIHALQCQSSDLTACVENGMTMPSPGSRTTHAQQSLPCPRPVRWPCSYKYKSPPPSSTTSSSQVTSSASTRIRNQESSAVFRTLRTHRGSQDF